MYKNTMRGILMMFAASIAFSLMNACVKLLDSLSPMELIFFRHVFTAICIGIWWFFYPPYKIDSKPHKKGGYFRLLARSLTGGLAMLAMFYNIATISLGTASAFAQTMPIYIVLFTLLFTKEHVRLPIILATMLGFIGVICICDIRTESLGIDNIIAGVINGIMMALAYMSLKDLKEYFSESSIIMGFAMTMVVVGGIFMFIDIPYLSGFVMPNMYEWLGILILGILGTIGQMFLTRAFMLAPAGLISPIDYMRIVWGVLFGIILGDSLPSMMTLTGIALIIVSGILIAMPVFLQDYKKYKSKFSHHNPK
ncbi:DMT family transporter [Helicobacter trogontum]|uniref:DMT family transporter n=1 Tax=Helicobacter trogontum TaxID=50960 RepID=A0A4U8SCQ3_9HELI|nr:DMT family transporter [Helicobacter trogontum]TLD83855.1 DMT family transporter [Helicobacter trogontum]